MQKGMKPVVKYVMGGVVAVGVLALSLYFGNGALYKGALTGVPGGSYVKIPVPVATLPNVQLTAQSNSSTARLGTTVVCNTFKIKNNMDVAIAMRKMVFKISSLDGKTEPVDMMLGLVNFDWVDALPNYHLDFSENSSTSFYVVFDVDSNSNASGILGVIVPAKSTSVESFTMDVKNTPSLIGKQFRCDFEPQLSKIYTTKDVPTTLNVSTGVLGTPVVILDAPIR